MTLYKKKNRYQTSTYPEDIYEKLEFDKVLELLEGYCYSPLGKEYVKRIKIIAEVDKLKKKLRQVHEFKMMLMEEIQDFPSENYLDLHQELKLLEIENYALNEEQIFRIAKVLKTMQDILYYFEKDEGERMEMYPELAELLEDLQFEKHLGAAIKEVMDEEGKMKPSASPELMRIRRFMNQRYRDLDTRFKAALMEYRKRNWLADEAESVRNGRRVLAVKSEFKRKIRGIIHDESGSGRTTFLEPDNIMLINNDITEAKQAEKREIYRILKELTKQIRPYRPQLQSYQRILGLLDFIRAKARFAVDLNASMPQILSERKIILNHARHPLLWLINQKTKKETVPLNAEISIVNRILVISGPNAGGKSVALKTVGLIQLMLQAGMLVPVDDYSQMGLFQKFFVDMGDEQSLENDLSTYSSRLKNMKYFTENADSKSLILIDEFGSGTDPAFGGAMAEAILEHLNKKYCYGVITTHYSNLKIYATKTKGIFNGCMTFDHENLSPKYKLELGKPGSSYAFELAKKSKLSEKIIDLAKEKVGKNYKEFDELLATLQSEKQEVSLKEAFVSKKESQLDDLLREYNAKQKTLDKKRRSLLLEAEQKALTLVGEYNKKLEQMMREWKESKNDKPKLKRIKEEIQKDRIKLSKSIEEHKDVLYFQPSKGELKIGSYVKLRDSNDVGKVVELRKNKAIVELGNFKTNVAVKQLVVVEKVKKRKVSSGTNYNSLHSASDFKSSLDIRGMRREEAMREVESFIDKALIVNASRIKIIHGVGDGILQKTVRQILKGANFIESIRYEEPEYGGTGISIIELK